MMKRLACSVEGWRSLRNRSSGSFGRRSRRGDRATVLIEDNLVRENPWLQLQRSDTSCTVNLQTYREARQKVRYSLIATNFRFAAK